MLVVLSMCLRVVNVASRDFFKSTLQWNESRDKVFKFLQSLIAFKIAACFKLSLASFSSWLEFHANDFSKN